MTREELICSKEYWLEVTQNDLYNNVFQFMKENNLNQTKLAKKLGVSKSYISQVLNGNFNHRLEKLIELSLAIDKVPIVKFTDIHDCLLLDAEDNLDTAQRIPEVTMSIDFNYNERIFGFDIKNDKIENSKNHSVYSNATFAKSF